MGLLRRQEGYKGLAAPRAMRPKGPVQKQLPAPPSHQGDWGITQAWVCGRPLLKHLCDKDKEISYYRRNMVCMGAYICAT